MKKEDYSELKAFINECAKSSINESGVDEGPVGLLGKAGKFFRRGASHADDAGRVAKGGVSHADDVAKRAARLGQWSQKFEAGIATLRKSIAADKAAADALLKRTKEISAKLAGGVGKNGKALNKANVEVMTKQVAENQAKYQKMIQQITQREQKLARHVGTSEKIKKELDALKTIKAESTAVLKTTQQSAKEMNKIRKAVGLGAVFVTGALVGSAFGGGQEAGAEGTSAEGAGDAGGAGGAGGARRQPDERVKRMQHALNAAGYNSGKEDGLLGPITRAAAKEAGIDPDTWDGTPEIKPKQQNNPEQQQGFDYSSDAAYGKYLGGADSREIKKFQYDFGIEPETGVYDAKTAGKAYELAHDTNDNNFKRAGGTIKAYVNWNAYEAGGNAANAQHAQNAATGAFNSALQALNTSLDKYGKGNPAANERLNNIRNFVKGNDFDGAMQAANSLAQIGAKKTIMQQISKCKQAYEAARKPAMNEMKEKFYDIFDRMNNATILQG